jgi:nucleoid DNA-binding protein
MPSDGGTVWSVAEQQLVVPETLNALTERLHALERIIARQLASTNRRRQSPRGRYWAPPTRDAASGGGRTLTRDKLALELQKRGLLFREARQAVKIILQTMIEELQVGGTIEDETLGRFLVVRRRRPRQLMRFGRQVVVNQQLKRVQFQRSKSLRTALRSSPLQEIAMPQTKNPQQLRCEKCGSLEFTEAEYRQYRQEWSGSTPGDDLQAMQNTVIRTKVCLCGEPILPGRRASYTNLDYGSFEKSFAAALQYRDTILPQGLLRRLTERFASRAQQDRLVERITNLERLAETIGRLSPGKKVKS